MARHRRPATEAPARRPPWNRRKLVGAKPPLKLSHVWSILTKLHIECRKQDLALFNLAIDSKWRGSDVAAIRVEDVAPSGYATDRATIRQANTGSPVRFELTDPARQAIDNQQLSATELEQIGSVPFLRTRRQGRPDHPPIRAPRSRVGRKYRT